MSIPIPKSHRISSDTVTFVSHSNITSNVKNIVTLMLLDGACSLTLTSPGCFLSVHEFVTLPWGVPIKKLLLSMNTNHLTHTYAIETAKAKLLVELPSLRALLGQELITLCPLAFPFTLVKTLLSCFLPSDLIEGRSRGILLWLLSHSCGSQHE